MDITPKLQTLIDKYLDGRLKGEALQAFEKQLVNDEMLAKEVEFQRELKAFLADSPENDLRKNLQLLNEQVELPKDSGTSWKLGLLFLPFFLLGAWWLFDNGLTQKMPIKTGKKTLPSPPHIPDSITGPVAAPPPTILMAFESNEALAALIEKNTANESFQLTTNHWQTDFEIRTLTDSLTINWTDSLVSQTALLEKQLQIHLFSNDASLFQDFSPIATHHLPLRQLSDTTYQLPLQKTYLLSPGRYYLVIQDAAQTTTYFVEEFFVRLAE